MQVSIIPPVEFLNLISTQCVSFLADRTPEHSHDHAGNHYRGCDHENDADDGRYTALTPASATADLHKTSGSVIVRFFSISPLFYLFLRFTLHLDINRITFKKVSDIVKKISII